MKDGKMAGREPQWPEAGDLVIATIESVTDHGAYAKIDEFQKQGCFMFSKYQLHGQKNIRNFIRERQQILHKQMDRSPLEGRHSGLET